jgi:RNA polymerase sigma-B factor
MRQSIPQDASVTVQRWPDHVLVSVRGVLDRDAMNAVEAVLEAAVDDVGVVVDLARVRLLDAHSVGELVTAYRRADAAGRELLIRGVHGPPLRILQLTGLDELVDESPRPRAGQAADRTIEYLLRARDRYARGPVCRDDLRRLAIAHGMGMALGLARPYRRRGESAEDVEQVAMLGLIKAIDGFDPAAPNTFPAYAFPTITGEIKRYFRDRARPIRPPRGVQETILELNSGRQQLTHRLRRSPTVAELAGHMRLSGEQVLEALEATQVAWPTSLSTSVAGEEDLVLSDLIGGPDHGMDMVDFRESVRPLVADLPLRTKHILLMRFYGELTQSQIAEHLGVSQMQISRLLRDTLDRLRAGLTCP